MEIKFQLQASRKDNLFFLDYFDKMKALAEEISIVGILIVNQDLRILILVGLNPRFNPCISSINIGDISMDEVNNQLLAYENLLVQHDKNEDNQGF